MKAMLFAAGKGTRLQPLTDHTPKCLVTAGSKTLLEHNINYLKSAGVQSIVVNVHHLAQQVIDFVEQNDFGVEIHISKETALLETGGGLFKAKEYFLEDDAFVVCNSDIYTDFDLRSMINTHRADKNLATLAVATRESSRYLRFDEKALLCGRENRITGDIIAWNNKDFESKAFNGVQVLSPFIFQYLEDLSVAFKGVFSTIDSYVNAAQEGQRIAAFSMDDAFWIDIGSVEKLEALRKYLE